VGFKEKLVDICCVRPLGYRREGGPRVEGEDVFSDCRRVEVCKSWGAAAV